MQKSIFTLNNNDIHVWIIEPEQVNDGALIAKLKSLLNTSEIEKVQRHRLPKAQHNALITRAFVRSVLSQYAPIKAQDWRFNTGPHGKPELQNPPIDLRFNLSHNDNLIVCAVCLNNNIGCDVESLSRKISIEAISKRYFSAQEYKSLSALPQALQQHRFFEYWTLKEAFVKATGLGISQGLESFSFSVGQASSQDYNDNIKLSFSQPVNEVNSGDWYSRLLYSDTNNCVAVCVNDKNNHNREYNVKLLQGLQYLNIFNSGT
jgi:4'-phosphopantetheinyl transferase